MLTYRQLINGRYYVSLPENALGIFIFRKGEDIWYNPYLDIVNLEKTGYNPICTYAKFRKATQTEIYIFKEKMKQTKKEKVLAIAKELCKANNTVSTLEIKNELRKRYPHNRWEQKEVSDTMNDFYNDGKFTFSDNGTYRVYSLVGTKKTTKPSKSTPKVNTMKATTTATRTRSTGTRISRSKALDMIKNSNGKFFTVTFIKKDGTRRVMNGQHTSDMGVSALGYINVKDMTAVRRKESATIKSVNLQTIETIRLGKTTYKVA